ncbi:MAG: hypothetical protein SFW64_07940 [Alphaproteobacteria bacterium]|nr:hypothetical protein [Alphaproteobacteria bacterium]
MTNQNDKPEEESKLSMAADAVIYNATALAAKANNALGLNIANEAHADLCGDSNGPSCAATKDYLATREPHSSIPEKVGYALGYGDAKFNEALGSGPVNDLAIERCAVFEDVPVMGTLQAPGCRAVKDVVAKRGK